MSKFAEQLSASNTEIKTARAEMLSEEVELEATGVVNQLKKDRITLKNKIARLTDLSPESKDSLRPASKEFNAKSWVTELVKTTMELKLKEVELKVAVDIQAEWFDNAK